MRALGRPVSSIFGKMTMNDINKVNWESHSLSEAIRILDVNHESLLTM